MGTATTYSTARLVASCGTSCVLSDWAHNLSGWARWRPADITAYAGRDSARLPRHRRWQTQGMREGPAPSRGPGPMTLSTGSAISVRGASPLRGRRRRRRAGQRARWQRRCSRRCWPACYLQCSCHPQVGAARQSAAAAQRWAAAARQSAATARESAGSHRASEARGNRMSKTPRYRTQRCFLMIRRPPRSTRAE